MLAAISLASDGKTEPGYRSYQFNYPHNLPADYVYRTPRVFGPPGDSASQDQPQVTGNQEDRGAASQGDHLQGEVRRLVSQLIQSSKEPLAGETQVLVASFVNLNRMNETSALGRYLGEQAMHELQQAGFDVLDVRMMVGMEISRGHGEYVLSRDMAQLNYLHHADAVLAGTYSVAEGQIFVNARLLENGSGRLLSSASVVFAQNGVTRAMLRDSAAPVRMARPVDIPVRAADAK